MDEPKLSMDTQDNGIQYSLKKETCRGDNCNNDYESPPIPDPQFMCHSCSAMVDSQGNSIGLGDMNCFDNPR